MDREHVRFRLGAENLNPDELYALALEALDLHLEADAAVSLRRMLAKHSQDYRLWQMLGLALRATLDAEQAHAAFRQAATLAPDDALIAHSSARTAMEAGLPASALYAHARSLAPSNGDILLGECVAMRTEGAADDACRRLANILVANPGWYEGHRGFARLAATHDRSHSLTATVDDALERFPRDPALWQIRYRILVEARDHDRAYATAMDGAALFGSEDWRRYAAICVAERGKASAAQILFDQLPPPRRAVDLVHEIRNLIRLHRYDAAERLAEWRFTDDKERLLWPYRALLWRLQGNPRWSWLEQQDGLIGSYDLSSCIGDIAELADVLRSIHARSGTMLDQSVRNGTQTDGHLLARREPAIRRLQVALSEAVATHVSRLPAPVPGHPTLIDRRSPLKFAGAWSVRLTGSGFHVDHVHSEGWLSSAFYVAVPNETPPLCDSGTLTATTEKPGWLTFGECRDIAPDLEGFHFVEPKVGHLVLFPSTMWHGTRPFAAGERMTVAFDIGLPQ